MISPDALATGITARAPKVHCNLRRLRPPPGPDSDCAGWLFTEMSFHSPRTHLEVVAAERTASLTAVGVIETTAFCTRLTLSHR